MFCFCSWIILVQSTYQRHWSIFYGSFSSLVIVYSEQVFAHEKLREKYWVNKNIWNLLWKYIYICISILIHSFINSYSYECSEPCDQVAVKFNEDQGNCLQRFWKYYKGFPGIAGRCSSVFIGDFKQVFGNRENVLSKVKKPQDNVNVFSNICSCNASQLLNV